MNTKKIKFSTAEDAEGKHELSDLNNVNVMRESLGLKPLATTSNNLSSSSSSSLSSSRLFSSSFSSLAPPSTVYVHKMWAKIRTELLKFHILATLIGHKEASGARTLEIAINRVLRQIGDKSKSEDDLLKQTTSETLQKYKCLMNIPDDSFIRKGLMINFQEKLERYNRLLASNRTSDDRKEKIRGRIEKLKNNIENWDSYDTFSAEDRTWIVGPYDFSSEIVLPRKNWKLVIENRHLFTSIADAYENKIPSSPPGEGAIVKLCEILTGTLEHLHNVLPSWEWNYYLAFLLRLFDMLCDCDYNSVSVAREKIYHLVMTESDLRLFFPRITTAKLSLWQTYVSLPTDLVKIIIGYNLASFDEVLENLIA